jgi:glycosyltransferase involved in cell wall biosynthesis
VEHQCEQLYSRLATKGFDITVYARSGYAAPRITSYKGMRVVCLPAIRTKHLEALSHTFLAVLHAGFSDFDILHIYSQGPFLLSPLAKLLKPKAPLFFTCGGLDWQRKKWSAFASLVISLGERFSAWFADPVVVVSEALGDYYRRRWNVEALCIVNGVDIPKPASRDMASFPGLEPQGYFLFVGRLVPEKRIDDLIAAVKNMKTSHKLAVVGGSAQAGDYERYLRDLAGDDPRIVFTGYRYDRELSALYSNALAYVTASELEGLPLTLLEGMSHGLPCLASDIAPHVEVLASTACLTFPVHDQEALTLRLEELATMPQAGLHALGESCLERVRRHYSWDEAAGKLALAYQESLGIRP